MSIQVQIMSDLHLEMMRGQPYTLAKTVADVVILAGDIHNGTRGIDWARAQFPTQEVIYVAGNHEYYGQVWADTPPALRQRAKALGCPVYLICDRILASSLAESITNLGTILPLARVPKIRH